MKEKAGYFRCRRPYVWRQGNLLWHWKFALAPGKFRAYLLLWGCNVTACLVTKRYTFQSRLELTGAGYRGNFKELPYFPIWPSIC